MHNLKLLTSALNYEIMSGRTESLTIICQTLHDMGIAASNRLSPSEAMMFMESNPKAKDIVRVLNALGYGLQTPPNTPKTALTEIAQKHLNLETLDTRNSDELDFSDQAVWGIKAALEAAFELGQKS